MSTKEIKRMYVIQQVDEKKMTTKEAGQHLGISIRQVRRLMAKLREKVAAGLVHRNRGRAANNRIDEAIQVKIQGLAKEEYQDYNDSHFTEELASEHELSVSRSSVRRIRRAMGQESPRKHRTSRHCSHRERKPKALAGASRRQNRINHRKRNSAPLLYKSDPRYLSLPAPILPDSQPAGWHRVAMKLNRNQGEMRKLCA